MIRSLVLAAALSCALACLSSVAEARPRHGVGGADVVVGCSQPDVRPCWHGEQGRSFRKGITKKPLRRRHFLIVSSSKEITRRNTASRPARYIVGRLVCAVNVNAELARRGIRGTGSALAKSFLGWGRASRPVAGAVAVYGRRGGGHVAIVSRVLGSRVYVWNPSSRHRAWREVEYRRRAIAYRVSSQ